MSGHVEQGYRQTDRIPEGYDASMVCVDPTVSREERETSIVFSDGYDTAEISSAQKVVIRYLLAHPDFEVEEIVWLGDRIVGVSGRLSKNNIRVTSKARQKFSSGFSRRRRKEVA